MCQGLRVLARVHTRVYLNNACSVLSSMLCWFVEYLNFSISLYTTRRAQRELDDIFEAVI